MKKTKIIPKNKEDKKRAKILGLVINDLFSKTPEFLDDVMELSLKIVVFNTKWGTEFNLCEKQQKKSSE